MVISSVQLNNSNVIPQPTSGRRPRRASFTGGSEASDSFEKPKKESPKKESFFFKNRGLFGFFAASLAGYIISANYLVPRLKEPTTLKEFAIELPIGVIFGLAGQIAAEQIGKKKD